MSLPNTAGIKAMQLVIMAPLTTSNSGMTTNTNNANPIVCIASKTNATKKSENVLRLYDLKMQILADLNKVPNSGTKKAQHMHQIHAT